MARKSQRGSKQEILESQIYYGLDGCWYYTGYVGVNGYGYLTIDSVRHRTHRLSYQIYKGPIPEGLYVCHKCDNRSCVNPDHLFLGTAKDNWHDCLSKGRIDFSYLSDVDGVRCVLTKNQAEEILRDWKEYPRIYFCHKFKVSRSAVSRVLNGKAYNEINNGINVSNGIRLKGKACGITKHAFDQYDLNGNLIATHYGIQAAAKAGNCNPSGLLKAAKRLTNKIGIYKGFIWKFHNLKSI